MARVDDMLSGCRPRLIASQSELSDSARAELVCAPGAQSSIAGFALQTLMANFPGRHAYFPMARQVGAVDYRRPL